jgi:hypothetical protein
MLRNGADGAQSAGNLPGLSTICSTEEIGRKSFSGTTRIEICRDSKTDPIDFDPD